MTGFAPVSPFLAGLRCRCPRCGEGALFQGLLTVRSACARCALDLSGHEQGDGPAVFGIFALGIILMGLAIWVEFRFEPPLWVHILLWIPVGLGLTVLILRVLKATLVALQFRHRRDDFDAR
jgi:uncharacterized protein (DUF983 family)